MLQTDAESTQDGLLTGATGLILCKRKGICGSFLKKEREEYTACPSGSTGIFFLYET